MRILLDTNIWREVSDTSLVGCLLETARDGRIDIQVAPSVLYETLRISDPALRTRLVKLMVRPEFNRLMPEAYSEISEILLAIRAHRPSWRRLAPPGA